MSGVADELAKRSQDPAVACTVCGLFTCPAELHRCRVQVADYSAEFEAYRDYHGPLLAYTRRCARKARLSDVDVDCKGVVQDAFLAALPHWGMLAEPRAYLFAIVRNLIVQGVRSSSSRWLYALEDARTELTLWWTSAVQRPPAEKVMAARRVFEVLATLPERQRVATYLSHIEGMSHAEIAELLGCAPATVAVHVHRGVERLRVDPHTAAAPSQQPDPLESKPLAARTQRALRKLRRVAVRVVLWLPLELAAFLARVLRLVEAGCRALYPAAAIGSLRSRESAVASIGVGSS